MCNITVALGMYMLVFSWVPPEIDLVWHDHHLVAPCCHGSLITLLSAIVKTVTHMPVIKQLISHRLMYFPSNQAVNKPPRKKSALNFATNALVRGLEFVQNWLFRHMLLIMQCNFIFLWLKVFNLPCEDSLLAVQINVYCTEMEAEPSCWWDTGRERR